MTNSSPALAPGYPDTANRATEMGWAQGVMHDGRPWLASLRETMRRWTKRMCSNC
jgi:hypothetical protein